jgi:phosphoglycolate phosphatase-like HAD superfamily hydrolase
VSGAPEAPIRPGRAPSLLLFDIDGTLVRGATDAHRDALHHALREVHGVDVTGARLTVSPAGRTDGEIARVLLLEAGVSADRIDSYADAVREVCCREYARLVPSDLSEFVLPGVFDLLSWLAASPDLARLALVTGNYEPVARMKLAAAGVGRSFEPGQGGFGSDSEDRAALPPIARRRAGTPGSPFPRERTIVIGDTPRDIACAHADGLRCVAVATGPFSEAELADADAVVADASALRPALESMLPV